MEPRRRFRIIKELSEGAFGKVYLAEMITGDNFKSVVAIKLLHGKWAGHEEIVQRSRDEARVLGLLHHRNIIRVEDLTSINGQCAVVMEYLNGVDMKTLCNYVRDRDLRIPRKVVLEVSAQISSALDAAYNHRPLQGGDPLELIHRDIKPSNVMLTCAGEVKVLDFGTAQARFDHREAHTQALAFGSAAYMAPERLLGDLDRPWGDVFSLGITIYEMLSLKSYGKVQVRPERNAEHLATCLSELNLDDMDADCATELKAFLSRMLSYEPEDRPNAVEVVDFMEDLADRVHDGTVRRFCREVVTPCREKVEPDQDPNDPLAGSTLFEDTTNISEHGTVVGGNWMDETEEEDSQASSLRSLGVDKGHIEASGSDFHARQSRDEADESSDSNDTRTGSDIHPMALPDPKGLSMDSEVEGEPDSLAGSDSTDESESVDAAVEEDLRAGSLVDEDSITLDDIPRAGPGVIHEAVTVEVEATTSSLGLFAGDAEPLEATTDNLSVVTENTEIGDEFEPTVSEHGGGSETRVSPSEDADSNSEASSVDVAPSRSSRMWIVASIGLLCLGGGAWVALDLLGSDPEPREDRDEDEDEDEDETSENADAGELPLTTEEGRVTMEPGGVYSVGQIGEDEGGSRIVLTLVGVDTRLTVLDLPGHFWTGEGTVEFSDVDPDRYINVEIRTEGHEMVGRRLVAQAGKVTCYRYEGDGREPLSVGCE